MTRLATVLRAFALAVSGGLLAALPASAQNEPWIFIVHDGEEEDRQYLTGMSDIRYLRNGDENGIYEWIAQNQREPDQGDGCGGSPLQVTTMQNAERIYQRAFNWYRSEGFTDSEFGRRPRAPVLQDVPIIDTPRQPGGHANYLTCPAGEPGTVMETWGTGPNSTNLIAVGAASNALNDHRPTFNLAAAHELSHVVQNNVAPYASDDREYTSGVKYYQLSGFKWITEGAADGVAVMAVQDRYGRDYFGPYSNKYTRRFFLSRPYNVPLALPAGDIQNIIYYSRFSGRERTLLQQINSKSLGQLDYQTNGFWYHVIERYLGDNPLRMRELYRRMNGMVVARNATGLVDLFLDDVDGSSLNGLEHVYPQFLTEYASWWDHRFGGTMSESTWLDLGFNGCTKIEVSINNPTETAEISLAEYAGQCFKVEVSSGAAALAPEMQIRLSQSRGGEVVDNVYLGRADASGYGDSRRNSDCYEIVEGNLSPKPAPCLLDPIQGRSQSQLQRYFHIPKLHSDGDEVEMTFIATWVPSDIQDVGDDFDLANIDVTISLDLARLAGADTGSRSGGGAGSGGSRGSVSNGASSEGSSAETDYASKQGRSRVLPEGETAPGEATPRDIFSGNIDALAGVPPQMRRQVMAAFDRSLTVRADPGEDNPGAATPEVSFQFMEDILPGMSGPVDVIAVSDRDGIVAIQNPEQPSRFIIERYDDETLQFRGVAHVCELDIQAMARPGGGRDFCQRPKTYRVSGAVAFPTVRNSQARLQSAETQSYLAYRDLRLDTLLGADDRGGLLHDAVGAGGPGGAGGGSGAGPVANPCDCSCENRPEPPGSASAQCRLLCTPQWRACPAD